MARLERLATCLVVLSLAGCASVVPSQPLPLGEPVNRFMETTTDPEEPKPILDFGVATCYLWNPRIANGSMFFAMIEKEGRFEVRPVILTDPLTESKLVQLFMVQGTPVPRPLNGVRGWIAVCKEEIDPKRAPKRACL